MPAHTLVHFAGHSRIVTADPGASHMVLARGRSFRDGVLYASDIAGLSLGGIHTVVLSSCGRTYEGETGESPVNGLAIAFLDAGVDAVVAGLWEAGDEGQMHLMVALHTALVGGATVEEALRLAQVEMLRSQRRDRLGAAAVQVLTGVRAMQQVPGAARTRSDTG
jgi:CHAT domain-containing protein